MSILKTALANVSPSLPKAQSKLFNAFQVEPFVHSLIFGRGLAPTDIVAPSMIGMNQHTAKSSMGSVLSVPGFVTGLTWSLCALAHGQKKLSAMQEGLPVASAYALSAGASHFKAGAGITAASLETIVLASLKAMLALPASSKRVTEAATADAAAANAAAANAATADAATADAAAANAAAANAAAANAADAADAADAAAADAAAAAANAAAANAAAANAAAETEQAPANYVRSITSMPRDEAESQLRAIALALGFRLVRIKAA